MIEGIFSFWQTITTTVERPKMTMSSSKNAISKQQHACPSD
jgi:hypothetical protein